MDTSSAWQTVLGELEVSLSKANFTTWFKNTKLLSVRDGKVVIGVPNIFTKEWLENKYHKQIAEALHKAVPDITSITYQVGTNMKEEEKIEEVEEVVEQEELAEERPEAAGLFNSKYTFDNFVVGDSSKLAFAAAQSVARNLGSVYNPLFIYGGVGLGKTHLMQAIGNEIGKKHPGKRVEYVSSEKFTSDFIASLNKMANNFKEKYRGVDVLLVDDMQFLAGKEQTQVEFFHTFNALHQAGKQIVIASDRPPKSIPTLEERLRSRFEWGLIVDIQAPDLETRIAILEKKSKAKGFHIPLEALDYIAKQIPNNIRELEGALNRICAYCELNNTKPNLDNVTNILGGLLAGSKRNNVNPRQIIEKTADFYDIGVDELTGSKRDKEIVVPRQIAMYLMREELHISYPKIAKEIGRKDHTTIMHGVEKIEKETDGNERLRQEINLIKERLYM
ncbi:MAG: chromosomal replication initiator protein DnaA [Patescibacteria group bacterium]|nr:chromosomal replication initiator protein DnaA [Patescibacteria group bacterium]